MMFVCICNAVTTSQVEQAVADGATSLWDVQKQLGVTANCGKCRDSVIAILKKQTPPLPATNTGKIDQEQS